MNESMFSLDLFKGSSCGGMWCVFAGWSEVALWGMFFSTPTSTTLQETPEGRDSLTLISPQSSGRMVASFPCMQHRKQGLLYTLIS